MGIDEIKIKDVKIQGSTLAVDGENFTESSHIFLNGKKLETTFVKPGRVTAKIERGRDVKIQGSTLAVDGENFTESSHIFLNGKKLETTFVKPGRVTAKIERGSVKPGDEVDVKQLGENDVALSSTNEYRIKED